MDERFFKLLEHYRKIKDGETKIYRHKITLSWQEAEEILQKLFGTRNRPIRRATVDRYSKDFCQDHWSESVTNSIKVFIPEPVCLYDGGHRLHAQVKSQISREWNIDFVYCTDQEARKREVLSIDQNKKRKEEKR